MTANRCSVNGSWVVRGSQLSDDIQEFEPFPQVLMKQMIPRADSIALIFPKDDIALTFRDVMNQASSFTKVLRERNIKEKDVVSTICRVCPQFPPVMLGTMLNGSILFPLHPDLDDREILNLYNTTSPSLVVVESDKVEKVTSIISELNPVPELIIIENLEDGSELNNESLSNIPCCATEGSPLLLLCTCGTAGPMKIVVHTSKTVGAMFQLLQNAGILYEESSHIQVTDYAWTSGMMVNLSCLYFGYRLTCLPEFEVESVLETIEKFQIMYVCLHVNMAQEFSNYPDLKKFNLSSVKHLRVSGALMCPALQRDVEEKTGLKVAQVYGMTECLFICSAGPDTPPGSVGQLFPGIEAKVSDLRSCRPVSPDVYGELHLRTLMATPGYYKDTSSTSKLLIGQDWLATGDVAYYDKDENFYIVSRLKDLIKYHCHHISPEEIECVLKNHPDVVEVVVVGVKSLVNIENATACVVRRKGSTLSADALIKLVKEKLPQHKWLHGGVIFVPEIPRTLTGNIRRAELREAAKAPGSSVSYI